MQAKNKENTLTKGRQDMVILKYIKKREDILTVVFIMEWGERKTDANAEDGLKKNKKREEIDCKRTDIY